MADHTHHSPYHTKVLPQAYRNERIEDPSRYIPSEELVSAIDTALLMGQPLLLTGEPGTGKTQLAAHIAYRFGLPKPLRFNAQTTSTAKDLFYRYDALGHFQYTQTHKERLSPEQIEEQFIKYEALGEAIRENKKVVVLIDEVDKAPRDLPNDLLAALEDLEFKVPETGKTEPYKASPENRPIIVLTSNSEKNLPDAFLRRVVYYHIPFPSPEKLLEILQLKVEGFPKEDLEAIVAHFNLIRDKKLKKNPATAELIFWALLLQHHQFPARQLRNLSDLDDAEKRRLAESYTVLAKNKEDLQALREMLSGRQR
jgi:MoxR-like ATPase